MVSEPRPAPPNSAGPSGPRWRAWEAGQETTRATVTSTRLPTTAGVESRLFPKMRSWFALGAPLELMSPLSVVRVLFALESLVWLVMGFVVPGRHLLGAVVAGTGALVIWVGLLKAHALAERESAALAAAAVADAAVLLWTGPSTLGAFGYVALSVPIGVTAALFLRGRLVLGLVGLGVAAVVVTGAHAGLGQALGAGALWATGAGGASAAVFLLVRTVQGQGRTDPDTGLPNGFGLARLVHQRGDWPIYVVASMALDGIADARQALGYRTGTELVRRAVEDLGQVLPADALIGRVVADELVVVRRLGAGTTPAPTEDGVPAEVSADAEAMAFKLVKAITSGRYLADGVEVALRAHVGMAIAPWDGTDVAELTRKASLSAPAAVANGLGVARWDGQTVALTAADLALLADLRLAGERGELALAYQPQISLKLGRTVSVEALLRWTSPTHGRVPPDRFIVLAERTGLIDRINEWVMAEALDAQARWRQAGLDLPVSVNVSARSLTRPDLAERTFEQLAIRSLPPRSLSLEITETAAPEDLARAVELLHPLHDQGVRISIDDFGVGYTSLSVLPRLALDEVKMDQGFVRRALTSGTDEAIVRSVSDLARRLGLDAVAEGVETEEMCRLVADAGYDLVQGYYFARPLAEADLIEFVTKEAAVPDLAAGPLAAGPLAAAPLAAEPAPAGPRNGGTSTPDGTLQQVQSA